MKTSCFLVVLLLAVATGSRLSLAAREDGTLGGELIAKAGNFLTSAGRPGADGWHSAAAAEVDASAKKAHGHPAGARKRLKKASVSCIPADMCRRKKVLCGKRCYKTAHAAAAAGGLTHVPSNRCVVRCKKCVPTC
ncbi:hypothetical protein D1007_12584 [Hordeum vulgare]|uniref:Predicted protein n=1 Tax=Hordeum vulgare subsp. vulgare TaxID=112509 RepID=F2EIM2_HORVV|nr:uncharacterized protein LOC123427306 [Hordeum vulgare subsp. vulgare]KAE8810657.1 hypothetical protein D1007_12584 [Hordeum vulgare]BAK07194.1 predicted protein [Hordeum vulgare subsp. vulgare]